MGATIQDKAIQDQTIQGKTIYLGEIAIEVIYKDIQNIHLSVLPPQGSVRISAPLRMDLDRIRVFAIAKLTWIKQQQAKFRNQPRETPREYLDRESHYLWGDRYLLQVIEKEAVPQVTLTPHHIQLQVRPGADIPKKQSLLEAAYRQQLKEAIPPLIVQWETRLDLSLAGFTIRKMKTKWGSCSPQNRTIRLNLELAKKPRQCLEYVILHEMLHLLEPSHNQRFIALLDQFMRQWRSYRDELNRLPVSHEQWKHQS